VHTVNIGISYRIIHYAACMMTFLISVGRMPDRDHSVTYPNGRASDYTSSRWNQDEAREALSHYQYSS